MRLLILASLLIAASAALFADPQHEVAQAEEQFRQALLHADAVAMAKLLADEFKVVHVNGREQNKAQFIDAVQSGRAKFLSIDFDEQEVRDFGASAIVIARWTNTIEFKGEQNHGQDRVTDVWIKLQAGWQLVSSHAAFIDQPKEAAAKPSTAEDEKEVLRLEKLLQDAWLRHDVAAVASVVADDLGYWSFKGARSGKSDLLKLVAQNGEASTRVDDPQVRVFGDTAIYTARITDSGKDKKGAPFESTSLVTTVFLRRDGKWQMVQDHERLIQK